jgi:hypothetical protein
VFLVSVNVTTLTGERAAIPEVLGLVTTQSTVEGAVAWTCANEEIAVRDIEVEILAEYGLYWYQEGPEDFQ